MGNSDKFDIINYCAKTKGELDDRLNRDRENVEKEVDLLTAKYMRRMEDRIKEMCIDENVDYVKILNLVGGAYGEGIQALMLDGKGNPTTKNSC